ncbi:MAG: mechanosensitive ion channel family protein [Candidatus Pacebacteria bacterium]|nr:mechanosensitive ion channel family protein [Candidatus Paceibacterota bacterium]
MNTDINSLMTVVVNWFQENALYIVAVFAVTWILSKFTGSIIRSLVRKIVPRGSFVSALEEKKREDTLIKILQSFFSLFIWIVAFLVALHIGGVPVAPLLTGAGILGVAIGFGSQSLVKDVITGLFIIAENQFRIGDVISVDANDHYYGTVEGMTLRVTKLRQLDGTIHYIPNGEIKIASNKSKDYSMVDLKINVGYDTKIDHVQQIVDTVGDELYNDPEFKHLMIEAPSFLRVDALSDYAITVRINGKVYPKQQYEVAGEMRKRLKKAFEANEIEIPYPTRVIHNVESKYEQKK